MKRKRNINISVIIIYNVSSGFMSKLKIKVTTRLESNIRPIVPQAFVCTTKH
jgi:hypothetical protein